MVRALHDAGLEVILDVVFNHTAEGSELRPDAVLPRPRQRGLLPAARTTAPATSTTPAAATLSTCISRSALRLVMDSLRYWVQEMHVDGFPLRPRGQPRPRCASDFDPLLLVPGGGRPGSGARAGEADRRAVGHRLGRLRPRSIPAPAGASGTASTATRSAISGARRAGSCPISPRASAAPATSTATADGGPTASVNLVTVHDGFTLADLVSYDGKHNEANGEDNRDGTDDNRSWNCGVEGPTDDPAVLALRARQRRNFIATLLLSEGVPLLLGGDEFARSQAGNNNAYCQDDELTWFDWSAVAQNADLVDFTAGLCRLREQHPVFRRRQFFTRHARRMRTAATTSTGIAPTAER